MNNLHYIYVQAMYTHTYIYIIQENMFQNMLLIIISNVIKKSGNAGGKKTKTINF